MRIFCAAAGLFVAVSFCQAQTKSGISLSQGIMAGEVGEESVILQARLTGGGADGLGGMAGVGRFEVSKSEDFEDVVRSEWLEARESCDHIVKACIKGLQRDTEYWYRLRFGADKSDVSVSEVGRFETLGGADAAEPVSFAVVAGMNYNKFHSSERVSGEDKRLGYPGLEAIRSAGPDFFVGTGDNVYFDHPRKPAAKTLEEMRGKYHEQFSQERYKRLFREVPTYWEKDDHDFRYNDCDLTGDRLPSVEDGIYSFREQLPVVCPGDEDAVTYRTYRVTKDLQIWLVEGRDYRSPNDMEDGPGKTLWGAVQLEWLKDTLLASDATFKVLISPTPMIGPDDAYKKDNHCNTGGFRYERDEFFAWLSENGFDSGNFAIVCGDRHWQYHSVDPSGFEEFSCGALVDANSRVGRLPGDKRSTDPEGEIEQPYCMTEPSGGFLLVSVLPSLNETAVKLGFKFYDEKKNVLYEHCKVSQ
ncbi:Alkaline phosphatase D precursor [Anaerohalosphaera lusitana]|uniref:Alkaline phosphatase D n=2 Tax=Anaerohalosphaera lusitana TaxID=1936003 RepID=A0A1U9NK69_9BACT|nr:Alkaline phosphatase D precursor [Anaerohalosphaera lusitana]